MMANRWNSLKRGDVIYVNMDGDNAVGSEQSGDRYAVVVQNNTGNRFSSTVVIAFITTDKGRANPLPTHVKIPRELNIISKDSVIMCEQLRTVSKDRVEKYCGKLPKDIKKKLDRSIYLSICKD